MIRIPINTHSLEDYRRFLAVKALPQYRFAGDYAEFPNEYASWLGMSPLSVESGQYRPSPGLWDYQRDITALAIRKRKFAIFALPGLGKTFCYTEYARHVANILPPGRCILLISPPNIIKQTLDEVENFYGDTLTIERVYSHNLTSWLTDGTARIGITNYEALRETTPQGRLGALILDESSVLKSHYGVWAQVCIRLGKGLEWKLAGTGTPAPNDRIEFANHAVFLDHFPTVNSFLARFFVNRGQTSERWVLKQHALKAFYLALSHWCIFLNNPATYGWADNTAPLPPINVNIHRVEMTAEQQGLAYQETGLLFADNIGGIKSRSVLSQIAKGHHRGKDVETKKPAYIRGLVDSWPNESTIIWCLFDNEQKLLEQHFPEAVSITGQTPDNKRQQAIDDFKSGRKRVLITKPKILGFGLNLQIATRQVFSGLQDSYEQYYQAVKRSNRYGSKRPLNVHIPIADIERPMIDTVLVKAKRVQQDTEEQERIFREMTHDYIEYRTDGTDADGTSGNAEAEGQKQGQGKRQREGQQAA